MPDFDAKPEEKKEEPKAELTQQQREGLARVPSMHSPTKIMLVKTERECLYAMIFMELGNATEKVLVEKEVLEDLIASYDELIKDEPEG